MERPNWAPEAVDLERPSVARVYDFYLGGSHNFAADRAFAAQVMRHMPEVPLVAQSNRAFLRRAVRFMCEQGVRQFVDLGSGIPTVGNVHEVAHDFDPACRVAYVDNDPVAIAHSRAILENEEHANTVVVAGDLRRPSEILSDAGLLSLIDFRQPVAFLLVSVLHFVPDEDKPADIVAGYAAAGVPGSFVALSHAGNENEIKQHEDEALELYKKSPNPLYLRTRAELREVLGDLTLVEPGIVRTDDWHPDPADDLTPPNPDAPDRMFAGVARRD